MGTYRVCAVWVWGGLLCAAAAAGEPLVRVKGKEADDLARIVADTLREVESFSVLLTRKRTTDFFEPVVTKGEVTWKKPFHAKWIDREPKTGKLESLSLLTPEKYLHYVPELNTVEVLDLENRPDARKTLRAYVRMLDGGYDAMAEKYAFLVFRLARDGVPGKGNRAPAGKGAEGEESGTPARAVPGAGAGGGEKEKKMPKDDVLTRWRRRCREFARAYGRSPGVYRLKCKPRTKALKKEIVHVALTVDEATVLSRVTVARADGEVVTYTVDRLRFVNKPIGGDFFTIHVPRDAEVKRLLEK